MNAERYFIIRNTCMGKPSRIITCILNADEGKHEDILISEPQQVSPRLGFK